MAILYYILGFALLISVVVILHEYGHYLACRARGIVPIEFSIFFGKKLTSFIDKHGTEWSIRAIPLGGFVRPYRDEDAKSVAGIDEIIIAASGPLMNFIVGILCLFFSAWFFDIPQHKKIFSQDLYVYNFSSIDGKYRVPDDSKIITASSSMLKAIANMGFTGTFNKGDVTKIKTPSGAIVIIPDNVALKFDSYLANNNSPLKLLLESIGLVFKIAKSLIYVLIEVIFSFNKDGKLTTVFSGNLLIANAIGSFDIGLVLVYLGLISISIGIFNLLPFEPFDGGKISIALYGVVTGKQVPEKFYRGFMIFGVVFLAFVLSMAIIGDLMLFMA